MAPCSSAILPILILMSGIFANTTDARSRLLQDTDPLVPIAEASPTLAPFQHVRFCLRYPDDCKSNPTKNGLIDLNDETLKLLDHVNRDVNAAISPMAKRYGPDLQDSWTISPSIGDCNDYAVTKRHALLQNGLPAQALRLSVVKTASGIGHLVLVVVTTKGDLVLDNLIGTIRPWQNADYHWLKIQSATDARFWYEVKATTIPSASQASRKIRLADR
jgi:predicted transglutaminase-like cysteine proteinase